MADPHVVDVYLTRLSDALGKDDFAALFDELSADSAVGQPEAIEIASKFVSPVSRSTSKDKALESVLRRHKSLMSFKLKRQAMRGRSAA